MFQPASIAPCGMNCGICLAFLRDKNRCEGCRIDSKHKPQSCQKCIIVNCELLKKTNSKFCYECEIYPCNRLKQLDKRYRTKYRMSMLENLAYIRDNGLSAFLQLETDRRVCPHCGTVLCIHRQFCLNCKQTWPA